MGWSWSMVKRKVERCSYSWGNRGMVWGNGGWSGRVGRMGRGVSNITTEGADILGISFWSITFFLVSTNSKSIVKN